VTDARWELRYAPRARRDLRRLDQQIRTRVIVTLDRLAADDQAIDVKRLSGSDEQRLRVGDWRVRFSRDAQTHTIVVLRILPRGRAYDR
jgi:mRNA-degrading endonuclease RelE of RelBE toxin-antitoxin system